MRPEPRIRKDNASSPASEGPGDSALLSSTAPVPSAAPAQPEPARIKEPEINAVPAGGSHVELFRYLLKVLPPLEPVNVSDYALFCLHSPGTNALRWYGLHGDTSDAYMTEILARDLCLPMLPPEKLVIMPRAADIFVRWCQDEPTEWIPLFTSGAFLFAAHYDPFATFPKNFPTCLVQRIVVSANAYDSLSESWKSVLVDHKRQGPLGPFPRQESDQRLWFAALGLSEQEITQSLKILAIGRIPFPLRELCLKLLPLGLEGDFLKHDQVFPFYRFQNSVFVSVPDSLSVAELAQIQSRLEFKLAGLSPIFVPANRQELVIELQSVLKPSQLQEAGQRLAEINSQDYLTVLLDKSLERKASDIHIEPMPLDSDYRVRVRLDGSLVTFGRIDSKLAAQLLNKIKISAGIDIAEKRQPVDGSFSHPCRGQDYDFRVSIIPQFDAGERVVLRILDSRRIPGSLEELGLANEDIHLVNKALSLEHGLVLVSGPTGSGKSTTLFAAMKSLPLDTASLQAVEDPVEFKLEGCAQFLASKSLPSDRLLRHILRADPDYILIAEIRDADTAAVATVAAHTGHLVLSTLHANDALSSLYRLKDFGVSFLLLIDVVRLIVAQRLIRKLCRKCRVKRAMTAIERTAFLKYGFPVECLEAPLYMSRGCNACNQSGYSTRFAVVESLFFSEPLIDALSSGSSREVVQRVMQEQRFRPMYKAGLTHVLRGETAFSELSSLSVRT